MSKCVVCEIPIKHGSKRCLEHWNEYKKTHFGQASAGKRFWKLVKKTKKCWLWTGHVYRGFGHLGVDSKYHGIRVQNYAWHFYRGLSFMRRKNIIQKCGNKLCVTPTHLVKLASLLILFVGSVQAYTVVTVSTAAPDGLEQSFISATTSQYSATVIKNPLASNTWTMKLLGLNPTYLPPVSSVDLLRSLVTVDSYTYVYGWADGMDYERTTELGFFTSPENQLGMPNGGFFINCSSAPYWNGMQVSTQTEQIVSIDSTTCNAVLSGVYNWIYQSEFSTPTIVNGY